MFDTESKTKKAVVAMPVASEAERLDALHHLMEGALRAHNYQEVATLAGLAQRYQQMMLVIYQVDDIIANGGSRRRRNQ